MAINFNSISGAAVTNAYIAFLKLRAQHPEAISPGDTQTLGIIATKKAGSFIDQLRILEVLGDQRKAVVDGVRDGLSLDNDKIKKRIGYMLQFFNSLSNDPAIKSPSSYSDIPSAIPRIMNEKVYAEGKKPGDDKLVLADSIPGIHQNDFQFIYGNRAKDLVSVGMHIFNKLNQEFIPDNDLFQLIIDTFPVTSKLLDSGKVKPDQVLVKFNAVDLYPDDVKALLHLLTETMGLS